VLTVLPGTLPQDELTRRLVDTDAAVVMKLGRNLPRVRAALDAAGLIDRALYVERATMADQRIVPLADFEEGADAPYFSLIVVPGRGRRL
jgi:precorrin-2/cobalt-factor-2 C20-methyltransferase